MPCSQIFSNLIILISGFVVVNSYSAIFTLSPDNSCRSVDLPEFGKPIIAACAAQGKSIIGNAELIERGYENIVERLSVLGADIKRID